MANRTIRTPQKRAKFLEVLAEGWSVQKAAAAAGMGRSAAFAWKREDHEFAAAWEAAYEDGTDHLEDVAQSRAEGASDTLLIFLLKGRRPNKYRERIEHTGKDGGPIETKSEIELGRRVAFVLTKAMRERLAAEPESDNGS